jgi:predicted  nucleic acid-binding Zn-ribbon protein
MVNLEEQIKLLVEAQALDSQILKLERELTEIPQRIKNIDDAFKAKMANLKSLEDKVKALQLKRKEREGDLETKEGMIKKYQTQMYQVKTNKEYTALQEEIARVKADNSIIEEDIIKLLDQVDIENQNISKEKEVLKSEEAKSAVEKKALEEDKVRIKNELEVLKAQRAELVGKIDKDILKKYERILKNRDGLAVVPVANESCQGCFRILPPQVINEIRMKQGLIVCENCARILYIEE